MVSIRLPEEMENRLDHLAEMTLRSKSFYVKEALERYFDDIEDVYIALERIARPKRKYYTSEELLKSLAKNKK
jgi:RHH-type rel operon transcriptional repressor/antitoxin RelB